MKALVGAFNQEKALLGAFSVIVQPIVEPMNRFTALISTHREADVSCRPLAAPHPVVGGAGVHSVMIPGHAT